MKILSINLNGLRSSLKKGLENFIEIHQPDILCFQEIRIQEKDLNLNSFFLSYPYRQFNYAVTPGYSGTAILSKIPFKQPLCTHENLLLADEGRYQFTTLKNSFLLGNLYLPSGTSGEKRQELKLASLENLNKFLMSQQKPLILVGDFNLTRSDKDLKNWKGNKEKPGCTTKERNLFESLLENNGLIDAQRYLFAEKEDLYTWWSYRAKAFEKNAGWRIDYCLLSKNLLSSLKKCEIHANPRLSDHGALMLEISL
jgi:exodeoxyribonuclease-3